MAGGAADRCTAAVDAPVRTPDAHRTAAPARAASPSQLAAPHRRSLIADFSTAAAAGDAVGMLAAVLAAKDNLLPFGWRLPGPPWCCGQCCGDVACFPCYMLPHEYVTQRIAFLSAAAAGAQPALPVQPLLLPLPLQLNGAPGAAPSKLYSAGLRTAEPQAAGAAEERRADASAAATPMRTAAEQSFAEFTPRGVAPPVADISAAALRLGGAAR
jgi:hypothetical protein